MSKFLVTRGLSSLLNQHNLLDCILPTIVEKSKNIPDTFQIWSFKRIVEADKKTNNFLLTCYIESEYLLELCLSEVEVLQYAEAFYNIDVDFDELKMWFEYDTLLLPSEH